MGWTRWPTAVALAAVAGAALLTAGCSGTAPTTAPETARFESVGVGDPTGDAQPLLQFDADDDSLLAADLTGASVMAFDGELSVTWKLAPGAIAAADGGNQRVAVRLTTGAGTYPSADLVVTRSPGVEPSLQLSTADEDDLQDATDPEGSRVTVDGDTIEAVVPVALLADLFPGDWQWGCTSTFSRAGTEPGDQLTGQDACSSIDAGAGSEPVTHDGVPLR